MGHTQSELEHIIQDAARRYYQDGTSPLTDDQFDAYVEILRNQYPESEILRKPGWGYSPTSTTKIKHKYGIVGSLPKCRNWDEFNKNLHNTDVDLSLKLDGMSVVLYIESGKIVSAVTRGDGEYGLDITEKALRILKSSYNLPETFSGAIRGEILMSLDNFRKFQESNPAAKNPRNATAGIIGRSEIDGDLDYLSLYVYTIVGSNGAVALDTMRQMRYCLELWFTDVVPSAIHRVPALDSENLSTIMEFYKSKFISANLPWDGIVITHTNVNIVGPSIEYTAQAFKFPTEIVETDVIDVEWNMSKTRYNIPRIHVKPVQLAGTTVEYAAGHNAQNIQDLQLGPGAKVKITKANEIIPYITEVLEPCQDVTLPDTCPDCGEQLSWHGVHLECTNPQCKNAVYQDTLIWISTLAGDLVDGFGDTLILKYLNQLIDFDILSDVSIDSIMQCDLDIHNLFDLSKSQDKQWVSIWDHIHDKDAQFSLKQAVVALNIPRLGPKTVNKLVCNADLVIQLYDAISANSVSAYAYIHTELSNVVGTANMESIRQNLTKFMQLHHIWDRIDLGSALTSTPTKGKVAITGKLSVKRSQLEAELLEAGWEPADIATDTVYLITDDPSSSSSKAKFAREHNITMISESEFRTKHLNNTVNTADSEPRISVSKKLF